MLEKHKEKNEAIEINSDIRIIKQEHKTVFEIIFQIF